MHRGLLIVGVLSAVSTVAGVAQQPSPALTFEVASIRPSGDTTGADHSEVQPSGRFVATNMTLDNLIRGVFEVERHELVVGERVPSWFASQKWDIVGKGPPITDEAAQRPQLRLMMQNLLIERFKLVIRREARDAPVYALVVARADRRLGPQLRPSSADCAALLTAFRATGARLLPNSPVCGLRPRLRGQFSAVGVPMTEFARALTPIAGRPVVDATGLTGAFDLEATFTETPGDPTSGASLFTAIQEQLGLRLESRRAPVNVLVIDSVERPTPD